MATSLEEDTLGVIPNLPTNLYLLLENPGKPNNLGSIIRCASGFGIETIIAIGSCKCSVEGTVR